MQEALVPPKIPLQAQIVEAPLAGQAGEAGEDVPAEQDVSVPYEVAASAYVLFLVPQIPFAVCSAVQESVVPLLMPKQDQETEAPLVGKAGEAGEPVPIVQIVSVPYEVAESAYLFSLLPQTPS